MLILDATAGEAFLLLGCPALIIVQLVVETPILRREPATQHRRAAATVLAIIALLTAAGLPITAGALDAFGMMLLGGLIVPAILTLVRLRQLPRAQTTPDRNTCRDCEPMTVGTGSDSTAESPEVWGVIATQRRVTTDAKTPVA